MTDPAGDIPPGDWRQLRENLDPDARIARELIDSVEQTLVGASNYGLFELVTKVIGGVATLEQRVLDLERAADR